jgi:hypothetical protein
MRMKIGISLTLILSRQGRGKKKEKEKGEGEDEGESPRFDMPWHVATLIRCNKTSEQMGLQDKMYIL